VSSLFVSIDSNVEWQTVASHDPNLMKVFPVLIMLQSGGGCSHRNSCFLTDSYWNLHIYNSCDSTKRLPKEEFFQRRLAGEFHIRYINVCFVPTTPLRSMPSGWKVRTCMMVYKVVAVLHRNTTKRELRSGCYCLLVIVQWGVPILVMGWRGVVIPP